MGGRAHGVAVGPGDGVRKRNPLGGDITFLVTGEQSNGALAVMEAVNAPGEGPPLHVHNREDETVYVLEGEFRWKLGDEVSVKGPGSLVFIPRGLAHTWQIMGKQPGRMLITFTPAGMEGFFDRLSTLTEFDPEVFRGVGAEYGMDVVGAPLAVTDPL